MSLDIGCDASAALGFVRLPSDQERRTGEENVV